MFATFLACPIFQCMQPLNSENQVDREAMKDLKRAHESAREVIVSSASTKYTLV
jgi:hypothetical protein